MFALLMLLTYDVQRDLEKVRDILKRQADRNIVARTVNSVGDGEEILRCKELIDQGFKRFEVRTTLVKIFCTLPDVIQGLHINFIENGHDIPPARLRIITVAQYRESSLFRASSTSHASL